MPADSILLLPHPEHREALLGDSPWGGRVPRAWRTYDPVPSWRLCTDRSPLPGSPADLDAPRALILRWRGVDDPMGCGRVAHIMGTMAVGADTTTECAESWRVGRIIRLDADGREVNDG